MALTESPSEKPETRTDQLIEIFSKLKDEMSTPDREKPEISLLLAKLQKKTPDERKEYKVNISLDFEEMNILFNSINKDEKNKIVTIMAPIFDAIDRGDADPIMESFLSNLLPPRSFIQDYYN